MPSLPSGMLFFLCRFHYHEFYVCICLGYVGTGLARASRQQAPRHLGPAGRDIWFVCYKIMLALYII